MENSIVYNKEGLLHGTVDTGSDGCVSNWHEGRLMSHYREVGLGWSIRVVKMWDSYYYSYRHIDYEKKLMREEIYGYKYGSASAPTSDSIKAGDIVFCAYKERPTFRVVESSDRMIADVADNVLFPLRIICKKVIHTDVSALLDADDVEAIHELLDVQIPKMEVVEEEETYALKSYNCSESAVDSDED